MSITLSIPPVIVQDARIYAKEHGTSLNQMIRDFLADVVRPKMPSKSSLAQEWKALAENTSSARKTPYVFKREDAYDREICRERLS